MDSDEIMPGNRECKADGNCQLLSSGSLFNGIPDYWQVEPFDAGEF
jgi:hypothetical protein